MCGNIIFILNDKSWALTWASHFPAERTLRENFRSSTQCFFGVSCFATTSDGLELTSLMKKIYLK